MSTPHSLTSVTKVTINRQNYTVTKLNGDNKITIQINNTMDKSLFTTDKGNFDTSSTSTINYTAKSGLQLNLIGT